MKMKLAQQFKNKSDAIKAWRKSEIDRLAKVDGQELAETIVSVREKNDLANVIFVPASQEAATGIKSGWWTYNYC